MGYNIFMDAIRDRHGRRLNIAFYGANGGSVKLTPAGLEAAMRVKRALRAKQALPGAPDFFARSFKKLLGLTPVKTCVRLWNGKKIFLHVPPDIGNFLNDIDGIILRDQYSAGAVRGKAVVDAGANIGIFSLYARALGAKKIYAFEAVRETFAMLKRNLTLNRAGGKIEAVNIALGKERRTAELLYSPHGEGSAAIAGGGRVNRSVTYPGRRQVRVAPLDALVKGEIGFLKMDVEGYEKNVLLGAAGLIGKHKPVLSFAAYHRKNDREELPRAVLRIANNYKITFNTFAEHNYYCEYMEAL